MTRSPLSSLDKKLAKIKKSIESKTANQNKLADSSRNLSENTVTKSHALSRAYYRLNLGEKRVMESLISRLHPLRSDNDLQDIELTATDYARTYNVNPKHAYRDLSDAVDGLVRKVISTTDDDRYSLRQTPLMSDAGYIKHEGRIVCTLNPRIVPHLIGLREKFSSYSLANAVNFKSSYTWRLYEILVSWAQPKSDTGGRFCGWFDLDTDELRKMLGVPESYNYGRFNKSVLDTVIRELYEKSNIVLQVTPKKTGRKITSLSISFMESDQLRLL